MKIELFSKIDEICTYYEEIRPSFENIALKIKRILENTVIKKSLFTLSISYRIKEPDSLKEKLIRTSAYRVNSTKEEIIRSFKDIVGLRIDCKFIEDESYIYNIIKTIFNETHDYIYYFNNQYPNLLLKLCEHQPCKQKNGFDIYKIEGRYVNNNEFTNFELQIKSLVNSFWGEIEHKISYKNKSYIVMDELVLDNMTSIKENLNLIDRQLHQLYGRYKREDNSNNRMRFKNLDSIMSKMLHDVFANKMSTDMGFVTDFKATCDAIVQYLLLTENANNIEDFGKVMLEVFYACNLISKNDLKFDERIDIQPNCNIINDLFCNNIFNTIQNLINNDFQWHLFFLMLFSIQRGNNSIAIENFIRYYKGRFMASVSFNLLNNDFQPDEISAIKNKLLEEISNIFSRKQNIKYLCKKGVAELNSSLTRVLEDISIHGPNNLNWDTMAGIYLSKLNEYVN